MHPRAPTERSVTVSRHSALLISIQRRRGPPPVRKRVGVSIDDPEPPHHVEITTRSPLDPICPLVSSQTGTPARLLARTNLEMSRPLRSTPITGASPLLRAGPPADAATVLNASGFRRQRAPSRYPPSTSPTGRQAVSAPAFPRSVQEPQTGLAPPKRRTPPGQYSGTRQAHPGNSWPPRFRCHLNVSTRPQWFAHARLPGPHLTPQRCLFRIAHHDGLQPTQHAVV